MTTTRHRLAAVAVLATVVATSGLGRADGLEIAVLDPAAVVADAADGRLDLNLAGTPYRLSVRPAPWSVDEQVVVLGDDGGGSVTALPGPRRAYVGEVAGSPGSAVLLTVTPSGVDGYVSTTGGTLAIEPLRFTDADAPAGVSAVRPLAARPRPFPAAGGAMSASSTRYVSLLGFADSQFYGRYGTAWADKVAGIRSHMNGVFIPDLGWGFTSGTTLLCQTTTCDGTRGATSTNRITLLYEWGSAMKTLHDQGTVFDAAFLYSGKNFQDPNAPLANGRAYSPGRYAVGQFVDEGSYNPSSSYEAGQLMAHELGHLFNADHDDGSFREPVFTCSLEVPVVGICLQGQTTNSGPRHWTVMCGNCNHQPPGEIWDQDLSAISRNEIVPCHDGTWFNGSYVPANPALGGESMAMGTSCDPST